MKKDKNIKFDKRRIINVIREAIYHRKKTNEHNSIINFLILITSNATSRNRAMFY